MKGFEVFFQPIVNPSKGMWEGVEALARWTSPEFGRVPPLVFIKMAEQTGLISSIGQWVLDTAISVCARLHLHDVEDFFLDVNLSPLQMSDESLISNALISLRRYGFPGRNLALEITESGTVDDGGYSQTIVERLRALDIKIALDDFGTGYSNFNNLKFMPVSILKTEKRFIDDIVTDEYQQFLLHVLVELAHAAEMKLIAEGVETPEQMKELMKNGADYFQGYLFARPLSAWDLEEYVHKFHEVDPMFAMARSQLDGWDSDESPRLETEVLRLGVDAHLSSDLPPRPAAQPLVDADALHQGASPHHSASFEMSRLEDNRWEAPQWEETPGAPQPRETQETEA
jgi:EAL domain-containing protein (putative c-di-GMP-specific phosphodiesterase class I)